MEHKTCKAVVLNADEAQGVVECIFSVFGVLDFGNDIVHNGSFTKTWNERGHKIRLLDSHNTHSVLSSLGKPLEFRELRRGELPQALMDEYPEATGGAWAKVQFNMKTDAGRDAFWHVASGDVDEWSWGYDPVDKDHTKITWRGQEVVARNLRTVKQYELSPVIFGMLEATTTTDAKSADDAKPTEGKPYGVVEEDGKYCVYKLDADGKPTGERLGSHATRAEARAQMRAMYASEGGKAGYYGEDEEEDKPEKADDGPEEAKAGRVLSARNAKRIKAAMDELHTCLMEAGLMEMPEDENDNTGPQKSDTPSTSDATGSQPEPDGAGTDNDSSTRLLKLIELELEETVV